MVKECILSYLQSHYIMCRRHSFPENDGSDLNSTCWYVVLNKNIHVFIQAIGVQFG